MLSDRILRLGFSSTLRIAAKAQQMRAEGIDVIDLSVGEPDFPTPANIREAAKRALDRNQTKYTANEGILELRKAIARKYSDECSASYTPDQVIVSTGAKQCLYNACLSLLNKGDEVIIPAPYWVSYPHMVSIAKGVPVFIPTKEENGFRLMPDELGRNISARTKAIILNNPSNPTGSAYSSEQMLKLIDICLDENIFIIADEIYEKLVYDGFPFRSVASFGDKVRQRAVIISGFSKSYAMTGWRLGFAVGPAELIGGMSKVQSHTTSNPTSITQWAGVEALTGPQNELMLMRQEFERRRNQALYRLNAIPHCSCYKPEGAFYLFPNLSWYYDKQFEGVEIRNSAGLAYFLLKQAHVAIIPGESFGADNFIRLSYATSLDLIEKGISRIAAALAKLQPMPKTRRLELRNTQTKVRQLLTVNAITAQDRENLVKESLAAMSYDNYYEWNVSVGGAQIKLATNSAHLNDFWMENWYPAPLETDLEPHCFIYAAKEAAGREPSVFYHPASQTGGMFNSAFYPQLRQLALTAAENFLCRTGDTVLVDGIGLDINGRGLILIAPPGTGGAKFLGNLLREPEVRLHSYDSLLVRFVGKSAIADSIERKFLLPTNLVRYLPELIPLFDRSNLENVITNRDDCELETCSDKTGCLLERGEPRCYIGSRRSMALLDPYWLGGAAKHVKRTELRHIVLLINEPTGEKITRPPADTALRLLEEGSMRDEKGAWRTIPFFNRYLISISDENNEIIRRNWRRLLATVELSVVNAAKVGSEEGSEMIYKLLKG